MSHVPVELDDMELAPAFQIHLSEEGMPGAFAAFPYDRDLVRRFREAFPRARWRGEQQRWFVPGITAVRRLDAWMSRELEILDRHADAKGRDAFAFDPLESPYLTVGDDLRIRTPYSRTVVEAMRAIPWAWWDAHKRIWRVPFRSYEDLRLRWPGIEAAARRNEPSERRKRRAARSRGGPDRSARIQAERRRRRYPVPGDDLPPLDCPVSTGSWGVVVFEAIGEEPLCDGSLRELYPQMVESPQHYVWARWRMPLLHELYRPKPVFDAEDAGLRQSRGWWPPSREELQHAARTLRERERATRSRQQSRKDAVDA